MIDLAYSSLAELKRGKWTGMIELLFEVGELVQVRKIAAADIIPCKPVGPAPAETHTAPAQDGAESVPEKIGTRNNPRA